jgi:pyruvate formate lyase activating enzyme
LPSEIGYKLARHFEIDDKRRVHCLLCPVGCRLREGKAGVCFGRKAIGGKLYATNYGETVSLSMDPIEKKPLYHFYPGSQILSVGPNGCNLRCKNCQNWQISQEQQPTRHIGPDRLVEIAAGSNSVGIAYTYTEPLIWWEYVYDAAQISRERGLKTVLVSNGYINEQPWRELVGYVDAINIDIKSMRPEFYRNVCKGSLDDVTRTAAIAVKQGIAVEFTNLVITNLNDSDDDFCKLADWIADLDVNIPLHLSRYFPQYKMEEPPTPISTLARAYQIARERLNYVYVGNASLAGASETHCPKCGNLLINRQGYSTDVAGIDNSRCSNCGRKVDIAL